MRKLSGLLAVSLVAVMMVPAARADIASTEYVDKNMEVKANKATDNYTSGSTTQYPSIKVAEAIAKVAAGAAVGDYALKTELEEEADARGQADTAINNKIGTVPTGKTVVKMIEEAQTAATYNDAAVKADIKKNADAITTNTANIAKKQDKLVASGENANIAGSDGVSVSIGTNGKITVAGNQAAINTALAGKQGKLTAGTGIKIDTTTNTISTDGLATNSDLTALQNTVSRHTASINKLDGADTVDGSVKQQIKMAKSELTTSIQANATAAANAKSAADAAQATANKAVVANTAITGSTKTKITYDAKGLVTGGSDLTAADIPTLTTGKISGLDTALAAKFVAPGTSAISKDGTYTLTMKVVNNQPTYAWEKIGRE